MKKGDGLMTINRRKMLTGLSGAALLPSVMMNSMPAQAAEALNVVEWGGNYYDVIRPISDQNPDYAINWVLHAGGAAAILAKIKAQWPNPEYDAVAVFSPVFSSMIKEDWLLSVTEADIPELANIPESLFMKDSAGNKKVVPRTITGLHWGYRKDKVPFVPTKIQDLLDPRFKGQIMFPAPVLNTNMQMVSLAKALGGDEKNLEPAWSFVKELAKAGNIGRVTTSGSDDFTSLASGETSIGFSASSVFSRIDGETKDVVLLNKAPRESGFLTIIVMEGWAILKGARLPATYGWINYMMSADNNKKLNDGIGAIPVNKNAEISEELKKVSYTEQELIDHTYAPDWGYVSDNVNGWAQRWETEIGPLL